MISEELKEKILKLTSYMDITKEELIEYHKECMEHAGRLIASFSRHHFLEDYPDFPGNKFAFYTYWERAINRRALGMPIDEKITESIQQIVAKENEAYIEAYANGIVDLVKNGELDNVEMLMIPHGVAKKVNEKLNIDSKGR